MPKAVCSDEQLVALIQERGVAAAARRLGISERAVHKRRRALEKREGAAVFGPHGHSPRVKKQEHPPRHELRTPNGIVLVGSDAHYWPGAPTTAHRALVQFCKALKPAAVVMNGDVFDGSSISRHPPIGWETQPTVQDELEAARARLGEIERAAKGAKLIWTLGNHDARFETRLATVAPQYAGVKGVHLRDHFPKWVPAWSCWINGNAVVKHRWKNGIHAAHNNAVGAGLTMVTGHLHSLKVTPWTDYTGTRYGVDTGTLADPAGPQFLDYTEDNPKNWRAGFVVLTFDKGRLLWPEVVHVLDAEHVEFRGKILGV